MNREQYTANRERRIEEARAYRANNADEVRRRDRERWPSRKAQTREYKQQNQQRFTEYGRQWRARNPGYHKEWRRRNPDRIAYEKAWRLANWDAILEKARIRHRTDPGPHTAAKHAYRARKRGAAHVDYTAAQLKAKFEYHGGRCWICRRVLLPGFNWDHVKPLNKGGADMLSNLRPACGPCNKAKRDQWPFHAVVTVQAQPGSA